MNFFCLLITVVPVSYAHMALTTPIPRGSLNLPNISHHEIDYSLTSPTTLSCQGKPARPPVQTLYAGKNVQVTMGGDATHEGGHCQFALSYNSGDQWAVIKTIRENCMVNTKTYTIPLPASLPDCSKCVFAWTWINKSGNREYYWNCVDVKITGGPKNGTVRGKELLIVNIPGAPVVPEWGGGLGRDKTGNKLLDERKSVILHVSDKV